MKKKNNEFITVRVPKPDKDILLARAGADGISLSDVVRILIKRSFKK
jgi:uncharacterized protein YpmB